MSRILEYAGIGLLAFLGGYFVASPKSVHTGHLTRDRNIDIVIQNKSNQNHIFLGDGNGDSTSLDDIELDSEQKQAIKKYVKDCFKKRDLEHYEDMRPKNSFSSKKEWIDYFNF